MSPVNMGKNAYVRMRGESWDVDPVTAGHLERNGIIWRDYDCEQSAVDNGYLDEGPCYGVTGESESEEEARNVRVVERVALDRSDDEMAKMAKAMDYDPDTQRDEDGPWGGGFARNH